MKDDAEKPEYDVGYGKPPKDKQFTKGRSGNRNGRPKGSKSLKTIIRTVLDEKITVTVNGKKKKITTAEVLARHAVQLALTKNDPKLLVAMGAFKDDVGSNNAFPNGPPEDFTLNFEGEPRQIFVNGEWICIDRPHPWADDPS